MKVTKKMMREFDGLRRLSTRPALDICRWCAVSVIDIVVQQSLQLVVSQFLFDTIQNVQKFFFSFSDLTCFVYEIIPNAVRTSVLAIINYLHSQNIVEKPYQLV